MMPTVTLCVKWIWSGKGYEEPGQFWKSPLNFNVKNSVHQIDISYDLLYGTSLLGVFIIECGLVYLVRKSHNESSLDMLGPAVNLSKMHAHICGKCDVFCGTVQI